MNYDDPEPGPVPVRANDPVWPWFVAGAATVAITALLFAGAIYFASLAHPPASGTPTIEERSK